MMLSHISLFLDELSGKLDLSSEEKTSDEKLKDKEVLSDGGTGGGGGRR